MELFANGAQTSLSGGIAIGATTLTVASAAAFPPTGNFRILIDSEYLLVTAVSGVTFTVTRAQEGSAAAAHGSGATVTQLITKGALAAFRSDGLQRGSAAARPAAGFPGVIYQCSDDVYWYRDNGTTWDAFGPVLPLTPPVFTGYSWANQGSATILQTANGSAYLSCPPAATDSIHAYMKTVPAAPYTFTAGFIPYVFGYTPDGMAGLVLSDGTKFIIFGFYGNNNATVLLTSKFTNATTVSANYNFLGGSSVLGPLFGAPAIFLRISDDGTTRHLFVSGDGLQFNEVANQSRTDFLTPTQLGFMVNPKVGAFGIASACRIIHLAG